MKKIWLVLLASVSFLAMSAGSAFALAIIDFGTGTMGAGGTIIIAGGNASGSGIPVDVLTVNGTSADGVYDTAGTATGTGATVPNPDAAALSFDTAANFIRIIGSVPGLGVGVSGPVTLLEGTFGSFTIVDAGVFGSLNGSGPDQKNESLLRALGVSPTTPFAFFGFSIGFNTQGTGSPYTATSTDIINTEVPEPASVLLIGSGLISLAIGRKYFSKK